MGCNQKEKGVSARVYHWNGGIQGHLGTEDGKLLKSRVLGCWILSGGEERLKYVWGFGAYFKKKSELGLIFFFLSMYWFPMKQLES